MAGLLQNTNGFLIFLPPHITRTIPNLVLPLSTLNSLSYNKDIQLSGSFSMPLLHKE